MIVIEGPRFSTRAESELFRKWGCDVVGMTCCPEVVLARELGIPYATVAVVTDYDCWKDTVEGVSSLISRFWHFQTNSESGQHRSGGGFDAQKRAEDALQCQLHLATAAEQRTTIPQRAGHSKDGIG
jgi:hypothetical protein